ncbi:MAG: helix-turn-helix domain-containing protein [Lachnospiraceae bacterium]|nr:helix-turn-helix domain-containing protein [Lachnospiraceae bacterium]
MSDISKHIRRIRQERGLTQEQLAEKMHLSRQAISNWETGKTSPDIDSLLALADILDTDVMELLYGEKSTNKNNPENVNLELIYKTVKEFILMKKIIKAIVTVALVGVLAFFAVQLFRYMKPDVRIGYDTQVSGYDPEKGYISAAKVSFNSRSIFGENKKIRQKAWDFGNESSRLFMELFNKYTLPIVLIEEVRNENGGMVVTFDGWGTLADGTIEDIHTETRFDYTVTDDIEKRPQSAAEMVSMFGKP